MDQLIIKVEGEEHAKQVIDALYAAGYKWTGYPYTTYRNLTCRWFFGEEDGRITCGSLSSREDYPGTYMDRVLVGGKLVAPGTIDASVTPDSVKEAVRTALSEALYSAARDLEDGTDPSVEHWTKINELKEFLTKP